MDTELTGRHILLLGLGVENRAVGHYLAACGLSFSVADVNQSPDLEEGDGTWEQAVESWHLGPQYLEGVEQGDLIFRTPGMHPDHPALARARRRGAQVSSQTRLFLSRCPAPVVGITGTKGKGSTASLLECMLRAGHPGSVWLGGNIGTPPLSFLDRIAPDDAVVLELSSFQLQDLDRSPQVAVVLSVTEDHLDWHGSVAEYTEAKSAICRFQTPADLVVADAACPTSMDLARRSDGRQMQFGPPEAVRVGVSVDETGLMWHPAAGEPDALLAADAMPAPGRHNLVNAAAAAAAALAMGVPQAAVRSGVARFRPLPHRLEPVGHLNGVGYWNDSLATNPDAVLAALATFETPLVLIAGGASKAADFRELAEQVTGRQVRAVVLLGDEGERLGRALTAAGFAGDIDLSPQTMEEAVAAARQRARRGDAVLLSPACASFGMYRNYAERGAAFIAAARDLGVR